jgi:hypothetical protein
MSGGLFAPASPPLDVARVGHDIAIIAEIIDPGPAGGVEQRVYYDAGVGTGGAFTLSEAWQGAALGHGFRKDSAHKEDAEGITNAG